MRLRNAVSMSAGLLLVMVAVNATAGTALSLALSPSASCSNADLNVSWQNTGDPHFEFGLVTNQSGATIGGFGPSGGRTGVANYTGGYGQPVSIPQLPNTIIGSYAWVGPNNPPTPATEIEFSIIYNCSTKAILYSCFGPYGRCLQSANGFSNIVPTMAPEMIVVMIAVLALTGALLYRRRERRA